MQRSLYALAIVLGLGGARPAAAQFHFGHRDTLPERVVQRALQAFNNHDVVALEAEYEPYFMYERMSDSTGPHLMSRVAMRDSLILVFERVKDVKERLSKRLLNGPVVTDLYVTTENHKKKKHLGIYEVRGGKIVREWRY
jgi:hypothetical protein